MRLPQAKALRKQASAYTRKRFKKRMIKLLKQLNAVIRKEAKRGNSIFSTTIRESGDSPWELMIVFRWYRRHSGLNVIIEETVTITNKEPKHRYIDEMYFRVNW